LGWRYFQLKSSRAVSPEPPPDPARLTFS
jgi:hypothetical protein